MTNQNISISIGGVDIASTPSTTVNVTQWVGNYYDYLHLCQKVWEMLTGEPAP